MLSLAGFLEGDPMAEPAMPADDLLDCTGLSCRKYSEVP
jgi:hypothetical protein